VLGPSSTAHYNNKNGLEEEGETWIWGLAAIVASSFIAIVTVCEIVQTWAHARQARKD